MPVRLYLWLLLPGVLGGGIGLEVAHRSGAAPVAARVPAVVAAHRAPAGGAVTEPRPAANALAPSPLASSAPGLHPLAHDGGRSRGGAAAAAPATTPPTDAGVAVVSFSAEPRSFAEAFGGSATAAASPPAAAATTTTAPPPAPTAPIEISGVHTVSLAPFGATIEWQTSEPVSSQIAYGLDSATLWTPADAPSLAHTAVVGGLAASTSYRLWVNAHAVDGRTASAAFLLTTPALTRPPSASTANAAFLLDGQPVFPLLVWGACPDSYASLTAVGIDTFLGKGCGDESKQLAALGTRGYLVGDAATAPPTGSVGTYLPDEWDTFLPGSLTAADVERMAPNRGGGPRFLTLTNHFFSGAAPLPQGRGMYPALVANADVVGFDLYPLQNWCRWDDFHVVFDAQKELASLAAGKPTFQWIEARRMDCRDPVLDPTAQTVRAETWLAIAGGAHAIGYFPKQFSSEVGAEIARDKREVVALAPALVDASTDASANNGDVRVGARQHNGAVYVIAVNAGRASTSTTITVPALGNRSLVSLDGTRTVTAASGSFSDTFAPLDVHIYVAAP